MDAPPAFWAAVAGVFGAIIGSFLNVVIWRLPRGESLVSPASHCPKCGTPLRAVDNIPIVSYLLLRGRCRACKEPISPRYAIVEAVTAALFVALVLRFGPGWQALAYCLFFAALLAALVIDLEMFLIPDELNTFALGVGVALGVAGMIGGAGAARPIMGWVPPFLLGAMVCSALFVFVQLLGYALFRKEAMGDGDVKLARAIGAMLPLGQALVSFLLAIAIGAIVGLLVVLFRRKQGGAEEEPEEEVAEEAEEEHGLRGILLYGLMYVFFVDLALQFGLWVRGLMGGGAGKADAVPLAEEEEDFHPGLTHIPFGPFMVLGAFAAVFLGDRLIHWYLVWARLAQ